MRSKKGKSVDERLVDLTKNEVFETLLATRSADIFKKLIAIEGDVSAAELGISPADRQRLTDSVHVVIHSAATLDFNETLRSTVTTNLLGTRRVMELCTQCRHLAALVHVSSAYVNSWLLDTEEILYPAPADCARVEEMVRTLSDEELAAQTPALLKGHPNTYTFTKHFAEHEVNKCAQRFPCGIVRPSMSELSFLVVAWFNRCVLLQLLYIEFIFDFSPGRLEGASSRLDDLQERAAGLPDGRLQGCRAPTPGLPRQDRRLHSSRHGGQSHSGDRPACCQQKVCAIPIR